MGHVQAPNCFGVDPDDPSARQADPALVVTNLPQFRRQLTEGGR